MVEDAASGVTVMNCPALKAAKQVRGIDNLTLKSAGPPRELEFGDTVRELLKSAYPVV